MASPLRCSSRRHGWVSPPATSPHEPARPPREYAWTAGPRATSDHSAQLRAAIEASGFETVEWVDETAWIRRWSQALGARLAAARTAATLPALLDDGPARMRNFVDALGNGILTVHRGTFTLAP